MYWLFVVALWPVLYGLVYPVLRVNAWRRRSGSWEAFNWTVVFLMAMPYATLAGCVGWIIYRYARAHRTREGGPGRLHVVRKGEC